MELSHLTHTPNARHPNPACIYCGGFEACIEVSYIFNCNSWRVGRCQSVKGVQTA